MFKKTICILISLALCLCLCSCGGKSGEEIELMGKKSDLAKSYMQKIFRLYEAETGNRIKLTEIEDSQFEAEALKRMQSGDGPDILMHFHNADLLRFDVSGSFCDLSGEEWVNDLTDSAKAYCTDSDGRLLGLPFWESSVSGCYYNKTLLDSLGLKPASSQAEFDMLCEAILESGRTPICWPADGCSWMIQFALDPLFADVPENLEKINRNEIKYSDLPEIEKMAEWISAASSNGWFGSDYLSTGWDGISPALSSGSAVMTFIWDTWFYTDFVPGTYTVDDFALMPVFLNTCDGGTYEGGNLNMMMVNKNSEKAEAALDFLRFCAEPDNYNAAFEGISTVSCFKGQTTNIQSKMVTDAAASISAKERVSTAASRIIGYSADGVAETVNKMLRGKLTPEQLVDELDSSRISEASAEGAEGF